MKRRRNNDFLDELQTTGYLRIGGMDKAVLAVSESEFHIAAGTNGQNSLIHGTPGCDRVLPCGGLDRNRLQSP
jgi:hypothetical protein